VQSAASHLRKSEQTITDFFCHKPLYIFLVGGWFSTGVVRSALDRCSVGMFIKRNTNVSNGFVSGDCGG
jgi:hypothetical protein